MINTTNITVTINITVEEKAEEAGAWQRKDGDTIYKLIGSEDDSDIVILENIDKYSPFYGRCINVNLKTLLTRWQYNEYA